MPEPRIAHYTHEYGSYYLRMPGSSTIHLMCDQVAVAYAVKDGFLFKHGNPEVILKWWKEKRHEAEPLFGELAVITLPLGYPVEKINRALDFKSIRHILDELGMLPSGV
jgi:hypothetical protein